MKNSQVKQHEAVLDRIIGARLTSVEFVLDDLALGFDGKGALTCLVWPEISIAGGVLKFGMKGYRDSLCELIPQPVSKAYVTEDETIMISVGDGQLRIPLRQRKFPGERAIFTAPKHFLHVW